MTRAEEDPTHGAAFEHSPVPALVYGWDGRARSANDAYRNLVGMEPGEALGLGVWDHLHEEDRERARLGWQRFSRGDEGLTEPPEVRIARRDGTWRWMVLLGTSVSGGEEVVLTLLDVTARRDAAAYVEALLEHSADIIVVTDANGAPIPGGSPWPVLLGFGPDAEVPGGLYGLLHPDDTHRAAQAWWEVLGGTLERHTPVEVRVADAQGDYRHYDLFFADLRGDPRVGGILISGRDVTERWAAQERLVTSEARYADLVDQMHEGLWCIDAAGVTTFVNPRMAAMLGTTAEKMVGTPMFEWIAPAFRSDALGRLAGRREGLVEVHEMTFRRADGSLLEALVSAAPTMVEGAMVEAVGVVTDISRLKETEAHLDAALREAQEANAAKVVFLSHVSHELRTPLNGIVGYAELLAARGDATTARYAQHITNAGRHLGRLIDDLLEVTRIERGESDVSLEEVALDMVIAQAATLTGVSPGRLTVSVGSERVVADRVRLVQVLINLLANALAHGPEGGGIHVVVQRAQGERVVILVRDGGPALGPRDAGAIFEPFVQLPGVGSRQGSGLGLAISRRLVEAMGGTLGVADEPTMCFAIDLPSAPTHEGAQEGAQEAQRALVVAVEDDLTSRLLLEDLFHDHPEMRLVAVSRLSDIAPLLAQGEVRLLLLDLNLPDGWGVDTLAALRAEASTARLPVMVVTADSDPGARASAEAAGVQGYFVKPYSIDCLLETAAALVGESSGVGVRVSALRHAAGRGGRGG